MLEQEMLCLSIIQEQGTPVEADESDALGRENKNIWDDEE
jgi:hypothetical protein